MFLKNQYLGSFYPIARSCKFLLLTACFALSGFAVTTASATEAAQASTSFHPEPVRDTCKTRFPGLPHIQIVGRKGDLIRFIVGNKVYTDGIRDGDGLHCERGTDTTLGIGFDDGWIRPFRLTSHHGDDVTITNDIIAVRHGRKRDLLRLYGVTRDGLGNVESLSMITFTPRDGEDAHLLNAEGDIIFTYGRKHDLKTRFCFSNGKWFRSEGNWRDRDGRPHRCNGGEVEISRLVKF